MESGLFKKLVSVRRELHQMPELGFNEFKTAAFIKAQLEELQIPVEHVASTGLIGTLKKGEGPTVMLRADMDALPVQEPSDVPYRSLNDGAMHACGHDLHMTMLLGAAHLLREADFQGTVKLVFQPSEEGNLRSPEKGKSGGQLIMESGKLAGVQAALGLHVHPLLPVGRLGYANGESLRAFSKDFYHELVDNMRVLFSSLETQFGCRTGLDFSAYYPSLLNDAEVHETLSPVHQRIFGRENVRTGDAYLVGEDFSFYSRIMPAQFYFLGAKTEQNDTFFLHHPQVTFNEDCIKYGAPLLADGAVRLLQTLSA